MCYSHLSVLRLVPIANALTNPQFIAQAEEKISQCITMPLDPEPQIEQICGLGVDPTFDQLISALGHIARQKPKPLIDSMMLWRKKKSDDASEARTQLQQVGLLLPVSKLCLSSEPVPKQFTSWPAFTKKYRTIQYSTRGDHCSPGFHCCSPRIRCPSRTPVHCFNIYTLSGSDRGHWSKHVDMYNARDGRKVGGDHFWPTENRRRGPT
jgi:hypothetical protein